MKRLITNLSCIVVLVLLAACSSHQPYPTDWQPLPDKPPVRCVIKTGLYENRMANDSRSSSLSSVFGFPSNSDYIHLRMNGELEMIASAVRYGEIIDTIVFDNVENKLVCKNGWLIFDNRGWKSGAAGFGYETQTTGLLINGDYLVSKNAESFAGMAYILPMVGFGSEWYRYRFVGDLNLEMLKEEALEQHKKGRIRFR